jgi:hypothetical protein
MTYMNRPWENEPNHIEFRYKGFPCIIHRAVFEESEPNIGHLCGYVGLSKEHPYYGKTWEGDNDEINQLVDAHGGITYANKCQGDICHVPANGETDDVWWIGFDCAHFGDFIPRPKILYEGMEDWNGKLHDLMNMTLAIVGKDKTRGESYKTVAFVKNEIRNLVKQLEKAA